MSTTRRQFLAFGPALSTIRPSATFTTPEGDVFDVNVLRVQPDDVVILTTPNLLSCDAADRIRAVAEHTFACRVAVLADGLTIVGVIRPSTTR